MKKIEKIMLIIMMLVGSQQLIASKFLIKLDNKGIVDSINVPQNAVVEDSTYPSCKAGQPMVTRSQLDNLITSGGDIENICVSEITDMSLLFKGKTVYFDITKWDVSNVTTMYQMFRGTTFNQDISKWNVSKVENMDYLFYSTKFNYDIGDWDVSSVKSMNKLFLNNQFFDQNISGWNVDNVLSYQDIFTNTVIKQENKPIKFR